MTITVGTSFITYNDGTTQQSANWRILDSNTAPSGTAYSVGTYLLCETRTYNGKTNPMPLDGWGRYYSGPSLMTNPSFSSGATTANAVYSSGMSNNVGAATYLQPCIMDAAYGGTTLAGTWVSRGSCPTQAFVVRVA
jgi:hypothetical protein